MALPAPLVPYLKDLRRTGLYGDTLEQVALDLIRAGVLQAIAGKMLTLRNL